MHTHILYNVLNFRNFFQNLVSQKIPKTIFGMFSVHWCKNLQKIPILTILNLQFICPLFSADPFTLETISGNLYSNFWTKFQHILEILLIVSV